MKKFALVILFALVLTGCSTENNVATSQSEKITIVLDWTPNTNHTGLYVAQKLGYFEEEGLDVEIIQPPEDGAVTLVGSGNAEFGISFQDSLAPALIGDSIPVTAVATIVEHNTSGIIRLSDGTENRPRSLEGKTYATWDSPIEKATLKMVVEKDGGDFSKVELIPSTVVDEVSALETNLVDAIWIFYGWAGIKAELAGLDFEYFEFRDIDSVFDFYTPILIANNEFLETNPESARAAIRAIQKGYTYSIENPEEAANILLEYAPELDSTLAIESQKYMSLNYQADADRWGYIDPTRWNNFYNFINENELLDEPIPENTGFSNEYLSEV